MKNKSGVKCDCFARKNKGNLMQQSLLLVFRHYLSLSAVSYVSKINKISLSPQFLYDSSLCISLSCRKWNYILSKISFCVLHVEVIWCFLHQTTPWVICLIKSSLKSILAVRLLCQKSFLKCVYRWSYTFCPLSNQHIYGS